MPPSHSFQITLAFCSSQIRLVSLFFALFCIKWNIILSRLNKSSSRRLLPKLSFKVFLLLFKLYPLSSPADLSLKLLPRISSPSLKNREKFLQFHLQNKDLSQLRPNEVLSPLPHFPTCLLRLRLPSPRLFIFLRPSLSCPRISFNNFKFQMSSLTTQLFTLSTCRLERRHLPLSASRAPLFAAQSPLLPILHVALRQIRLSAAITSGRLTATRRRRPASGFTSVSTPVLASTLAISPLPFSFYLLSLFY
jgi:hypothetical protein